MASEPAFPVGRTLLAAGIFLALGLLAFGLALNEAQAVAREISAGDGLVALWAAVLGGFPLAAMFIAVTTLSVLSLGAGRARRSAKPIMAFAFAAFLLTFIVPWLSEAALDRHLTRTGYVRCPAIYERPVSHTRWAHMLAACPVSRA